MNELRLIDSRSFGKIQCDFYSDGKELWMTRVQVGTALEYAFPQEAVQKIHERHPERLDKYSVQVKLTSTDGKAYDTTLYNRKGVMEVCRHSKQPKADAFMDFCWDTMDGLMSGETKLVTMPQDYPSALRALADEAEKNLALAAEKDRLQAELDESMEWLSIKRVAFVNGMSHKNIDWRKLKAAGEAMGYGTRKIWDANYGSVNTYNRKVWAAVYPEYRLEGQP